MLSAPQELESLRASVDNNRSLFPDSDSEQHSFEQSNSPAKPPEWPGPYQRLQWRWSSMPWKFELLSWICGFCFTIATVVLLIVLHGRPLPNLRFGITPNAIINLLSTFAEVFLMVPVSSAMGQIKWLQALQKRPMDEFRLIDEASRGPWGSTVLLSRRKGGVLACFGAFVTILALGISTFFQQALNYDTIYPHAIDAYMPVAQYMNGSGTAPVGDDTTMYGIDTQLLSSPYVALYSPSKTEFTATAIAHCGTGNCTWESYQTLGICNTCANLTSKLEMTKVHIVPDNNSTLAYDTNYYTLPNGFGLTGIQPGEGYSQLNFWDVSTAILNITTTLTHAWDSIAFANNGSKLFSVFAVGASPGTIPAQIDETYSTESMNGSSFAPPIAFECLLQFCIRNMTAEFTHGTLFESEQSSWTDQSQPVVDAKNPDADITLQPPDSSTSFLATGTAIHGTGQWLSRLVAGNVTNKPLISDPSNEWQLQAADYSSDLMQAFYMEMNSSSTGFPDLMDNLANSLSLNLRQISYQPSVKGNAFSSTSHAVVTWEWLILPLIELVASLVFLIAVMVETSKNGLLPWTNNVLALFFHGLDERPLGRRVRESGDHMRDKAREVMMEFDRHKNGGRLFITES